MEIFTNEEFLRKVVLQHRFEFEARRSVFSEISNFLKQVEQIEMDECKNQRPSQSFPSIHKLILPYAVLRLNFGRLRNIIRERLDSQEEIHEMILCIIAEIRDDVSLVLFFGSSCFDENGKEKQEFSLAKVGKETFGNISLDIGFLRKAVVTQVREATSY